jgi:hypothetical protein
MDMIESGDRVMIYEDPVTRLCPEGVATVVDGRKVRGHVDGALRGPVRFDGEDEMVVERTFELRDRLTGAAR